MPHSNTEKFFTPIVPCLVCLVFVSFAVTAAWYIVVHSLFPVFRVAMVAE